MVIVFLLLALPNLIPVLRAESPVAGERADRIEAAADFINAYASAEGIRTLIDHWLGWQLDFYLGAQPNVERLYLFGPGDLNRERLARCPCLFAVPAYEPLAPWLERIASAGYNARIVYESDGFTIYRMEG
jgi:hypothetical protein